MDAATLAQEHSRYFGLLNRMTVKNPQRAREIQLSKVSPAEKMRLFETELGGGTPLQWEDLDYLRKLGQ